EVASDRCPGARHRRQHPGPMVAAQQCAGRLDRYGPGPWLLLALENRELFQAPQKPRPPIRGMATTNRRRHCEPFVDRLDGLSGGLAIASRYVSGGRSIQKYPGPAQWTSD